MIYSLSYPAQENVDDPQIVTDQPRSRLQQVDRAMKDIVDKEEEGAAQKMLFVSIFFSSVHGRRSLSHCFVWFRVLRNSICQQPGLSFDEIRGIQRRK
jgi:hypothetical protein